MQTLIKRANCGVRSGCTLFSHGQKLDSGLIFVGTSWYFCKPIIQTLIERANSGVRSGSTLFAYGQKLDSGLILVGTSWYFCKQIMQTLIERANSGVRSGSTLFAYGQTFGLWAYIGRYKLIFLQSNYADPDQTR